MLSDKSVGNHMITFNNFFDILLPCNAASCKIVNLGGFDGRQRAAHCLGLFELEIPFALHAPNSSDVVDMVFIVLISSIFLCTLLFSDFSIFLFIILNLQLPALISICISSLSILFSGNRSSEDNCCPTCCAAIKMFVGLAYCREQQKQDHAQSLLAISASPVTKLAMAPKSTWALAVSGSAGSRNVSYSIGR